MSELQKDVERELEKLPEAERDAKRTQFAVFVVHNKLKPKLAELPAGIPCVRLLAYSRLSPAPLPAPASASLCFPRGSVRRGTRANGLPERLTDSPLPARRYFAGEEIDDLW